MGTDCADLMYLRGVREANVTIVRQERLSKPEDSNLPLKEREFYGLRIQDLTESWQPGYEVTQWRDRWDEIEQQFFGEDMQQERWITLQTAMQSYTARLRSLNEQGFTHSDLDF